MTISKKENNYYFKELESLRFWCCIWVVWVHIQFIEGFFYPNLIDKKTLLDPLNANMLIGETIMSLLFTLSGFLISVVLLRTKLQTDRIDIAFFYTKRILRIWPLYYLTIILSLFILPSFEFFHIPNSSEFVYTNWTLKLLLYLFMLPQIARFSTKFIPYLGHTWTIGVEELFYFIWPLFLRNTKRYLLFFISIIVFFTGISLLAGVHPAGHKLPEYAKAETQFGIFVQHFFYYNRLSCMAIGGIAAYLLLFEKTKITNIIFNKYFQVILYLLCIILTYNLIYIPYFHHEFYSILSACIILNLAANPNKLFSIHTNFTYLIGKMSYGVYMFHFIAITIAIKILATLTTIETLAPIFRDLSLFILSYPITILISYVSYSYIEQPIINIRKKQIL